MTSDKKGMIAQIVVAVTIALIAGGSAPWWWNELNKDSTSATSSKAVWFAPG